MYRFLKGVKDILQTREFCARQLSMKNSLHFQQQPAQCDILEVGDSVGTSYQVPLEHRAEAWVKQLEALLNRKGLPLPVKVTNCSVPGYHTTEGRALLSLHIEAFRPKVIIITLGGNDAHEHRDVFEILADMEEFVKIAKSYNIKHILWGMGIPKTFPVCRGYRNSFAGMQKEFSKRTGVKTVTMPDKILHENNIHKDRLHFNTAVQKDIAEFACKHIEPMARVACDEILREYRQNQNQNQNQGQGQGQGQDKGQGSVKTSGLPSNNVIAPQFAQWNSSSSAPSQAQKQGETPKADLRNDRYTPRKPTEPSSS